MKSVWRWVAYTTGALCVLVGGYAARQYLRWEIVRADGAEVRPVYLPDGSVAWLRPGATLWFRGAPAVRQCRAEGQLLLEISPGRSDSLPLQLEPIALLAPSGSTFVVESTNEKRVVYGVGEVPVAVQLPSGVRIVGQNYRLEYNLVQGVDTQYYALPGNSLAWKDRRLQFERARLVDVLADLTVYFSIPFELGAPNLAELRFSGAFLNPSPREILDVLSRSLPVTYRVAGRGYVLEPGP